MNKLIILLLVVCLVSVHAFVKRDAPEAPKNGNAIEDTLKQLQDVAKQLSEKVGETFSADNIQKNFNAASEQISKLVEELKPKQEAPKA